MNAAFACWECSDDECCEYFHDFGGDYVDTIAAEHRDSKDYGSDCRGVAMILPLILILIGLYIILIFVSMVQR